MTRPSRIAHGLRRVVVAGAVALAMTGCASAPLQRHSSDVRTTALFPESCRLPPAQGDPGPTESASVVSHAYVVGREGNGKTADGTCNRTSIESMAERFLTIQEADEERGIPGDTLEQVRQKGFTIYLDAQGRMRRPNTRVLHGTEALAAVGLAVSPPPLQKPEEVKAYTEFMGQHYAEEYVERDVKNVVDRVCLNRRDSHEVGDDRTFAILLRSGRVIKRVIKGGPVDNPKHERAFLVCPGDFILDLLKGGIDKTVKGVTPGL